MERKQKTSSGLLWSSGCVWLSLAFILFFVLLIAVRSWQTGKSPFESLPQQDVSVQHDSLTK